MLPPKIYAYLTVLTTLAIRQLELHKIFEIECNIMILDSEFCYLAKSNKEYSNCNPQNQIEDICVMSWQH